MTIPLFRFFLGAEEGGEGGYPGLGEACWVRQGTYPLARLGEQVGELRELGGQGRQELEPRAPLQSDIVSADLTSCQEAACGRPLHAGVSLSAGGSRQCLTHTYARACGSLNALQPPAWPCWKAERVEKEEPQHISLLRFFFFFFFAKVNTGKRLGILSKSVLRFYTSSSNSTPLCVVCVHARSRMKHRPGDDKHSSDAPTPPNPWGKITGAGRESRGQVLMVVLNLNSVDPYSFLCSHAQLLPSCHLLTPRFF